MPVKNLKDIKTLVQQAERLGYKHQGTNCGFGECGVALKLHPTKTESEMKSDMQKIFGKVTRAINVSMRYKQINVDVEYGGGSTTSGRISFGKALKVGDTIRIPSGKGGDIVSVSGKDAKVKMNDGTTKTFPVSSLKLEPRDPVAEHIGRKPRNLRFGKSIGCVCGKHFIEKITRGQKYCISQKMPINMKEFPTQEQAIAVTMSQCGVPKPKEAQCSKCGHTKKDYLMNIAKSLIKDDLKVDDIIDFRGRKYKVVGFVGSSGIRVFDDASDSIRIIPRSSLSKSIKLPNGKVVDIGEKIKYKSKAGIIEAKIIEFRSDALLVRAKNQTVLVPFKLVLK